MNLFAAFPFLRIKPPKQVISDSWQERFSILKTDVNLFCWSRPTHPLVLDYLKTLQKRELVPIRFNSHLNEIAQNVEEARKVWDPQGSEASGLFWEDVSNLIRDFLSFSQEKTGTVHLKLVDNDACTKFHVDGYSLRLLTTYYGRGTEWLPEKAVNRSALGTSNDSIVKNPSRIECMNTFDVAILKGEIPGRFSPVKGIVHRSPEIAHLKEKRIILRVDI